MDDYDDDDDDGRSGSDKVGCDIITKTDPPLASTVQSAA
jgi:hypothetical protein